MGQESWCSGSGCSVGQGQNVGGSTVAYHRNGAAVVVVLAPVEFRDQVVVQGRVVGDALNQRPATHQDQLYSPFPSVSRLSPFQHLRLLSWSHSVEEDDA